MMPARCSSPRQHCAPAHHGQRPSSKADAAEITVDRDKELRARGAGARALPSGAYEKTAPGEGAVANSTSHGTRWPKIDGGVAKG